MTAGSQGKDVCIWDRLCRECTRTLLSIGRLVPYSRFVLGHVNIRWKCAWIIERSGRPGSLSRDKHMWGWHAQSEVRCLGRHHWKRGLKLIGNSTKTLVYGYQILYRAGDKWWIEFSSSRGSSDSTKSIQLKSRLDSHKNLEPSTTNLSIPQPSVSSGQYLLQDQSLTIFGWGSPES